METEIFNLVTSPGHLTYGYKKKHDTTEVRDTGIKDCTNLL